MIERNPLNAPGPFYVEKGACISCGAPEAEAPTLLAMDDEAGCYFRRQPETSSEVDAALRAMMVACIEVHRYGGRDPEILRRLAEAGHSDLCDYPGEGHLRRMVDHVRFSLPEQREASNAVGVAVLVLAWLQAAARGDGLCTRLVAGTVERATFEHTPSARYGRPNAYTVDRIRRLPLAADPSPYRQSGTTQDWLLHAERGASFDLHDILVANGALDLRWFTRDEWERRAAGTALPY